MWLLVTLLSVLILVAGCQGIPQPAKSSTPTATTSETPTATTTPLPVATTTPTSAALSTSTASPVVPPSPTAPPTPLPTLAPTSGPIPSPTLALPRFSALEASKHVEKLAVEIGSRPSNSSALSQAAQYLVGQLAAMGYDARLQPYSFPLFQERSVQLALRQPQTVQIAARSFVYSGSGSIDGLLVNCGFGSPADFPASGLRGQIALTERGGGLTFQDKVAAAAARGAAGVVVFNDRSGDFRGTLTQQASIPAVGIQQSDGKRLQEYLRQGATTVSLKVDVSTQPRQGSNVVASLKGTSSPMKVVVGAHYDSVSAGPGANDNGSGVATLLELARAVRFHQYPFDLVFVAFGDEEIGLVGSKRYLELIRPEERAQIAAMVNFDMVGVGDRMEFGGDRDLVNRSLQIARDLGYPASTLALKAGATSDHASFQEAGIPAVFFYRSEDPNYHTKMDMAEKVVPENLEAAGKVALRLLTELAGRN